MNKWIAALILISLGLLVIAWHFMVAIPEILLEKYSRPLRE